LCGGEGRFQLLFLLAIQGWTYTEAERMLPPDSFLHMNDLLSSGLLFVHNGRFFVPPILLQALAGKNQTPLQFADQMFSGKLTPKDFKEFCTCFFMQKSNLLVSHGIQKISIAEFFNGAWISPWASCWEITLGTGDKRPCLERTPAALWTGDPDTHQEGILSLPNTRIQFAMNYSIGDALTGTAFHSEQKKAENSPIRQPGNTNLFVYITNCQMTNNVEKRNQVQHDSSIIICSETFTRVFSPTFEYITSQIKKTHWLFH
jgi:hypothetical protein